MTTSADLGIVYIAGQQAQPEITHNTALNQLQILQTGVISVALNTPPGSPAQGDTYILGASPTGAWAGRANCLAGYFGTGWVFVPGADSSGTQIPMGVRHEGLKVYSKADNALYVWSGSAWAASGAGMTNPMTTSQDLIVGGASGTPTRLASGTNGYVLSMVAGSVAWAVATGFANPMTTSGDIIYGGASGVATRLAAGTNGHVLTLTAGVPTWAAAAAGMSNPMTASGDIIYGGASGVPTRLAAGANTQVLTLAGGVPTWATPTSGGMTNPMTASGDIIFGGASGAPTRLAPGTNTHVLTLAAGVPTWAAPSGGGSITVQDEGSSLTTAVTKFNFAGAGVTVTEPVTDEMLVTIPGGSPWVELASWTYSSDVANVDFTGLAGYSEIMVIGKGITLSVAGVRALRFSTDNGSSYYSGSSDYYTCQLTGISTQASSLVAHNTANSTARDFTATLRLANLTTPRKDVVLTAGLTGYFDGSSSPVNAIRVLSTVAGNLTGGTIKVFGKV